MPAFLLQPRVRLRTKVWGLATLVLAVAFAGAAWWLVRAQGREAEASFEARVRGAHEAALAAVVEAGRRLVADPAARADASAGLLPALRAAPPRIPLPVAWEGRLLLAARFPDSEEKPLAARPLEELLSGAAPPGGRLWALPAPFIPREIRLPDGLKEKVLAGGVQMGSAPVRGIGPWARWTQEPYRVAASRLQGPGNETAGILVVGFPEGPFQGGQAAWRRRILAAFLVAGLAGAVLMGIVAFHVTRPLPALVEASLHLGTGDLDHHADVRSRDELGLLARTLDEAAAALKRDRVDLRRAERIAAWREVARRIAHEIKNPLASIRLSAENLRRAAPLGREALEESAREAAEVIAEEVEGLRRLADSFSELAKLPEPVAAPTDLAAVAERIAALFREGLSPGVTLRVESEAGLPRVPADETQVAQVLKNLVKNSLEALDGGGGEVGVRIARRGRCAEIAVEDTGPGVAPEAAARLFEPYVTTKPSGTGLGLVISRQIAQAHGGELHYEPRPGGGSRFALRIPLEGAEGGGRG